MKLNSLICILLLFAVSAYVYGQNSLAAPPGHQMLADPEKFADGHLAALDQRLHLSADQKAKLRPVFLSEAKQLFALLDDHSLTPAQKQVAIEKLHLDTAAKVDSMLTPEQRHQFASPNPNPVPSHMSQT